MQRVNNGKVWLSGREYIIYLDLKRFTSTGSALCTTFCKRRALFKSKATLTAKETKNPHTSYRRFIFIDIFHLASVFGRAHRSSYLASLFSKWYSIFSRGAPGELLLLFIRRCQAAPSSILPFGKSLFLCF